MPALEICRQLANYITTFGCFVHLEPKTNIVRLQFEILNHPVFIVSENRTLRYLFRFNWLNFVDFQFGGFVPFLRSRSFTLA